MPREPLLNVKTFDIMFYCSKLIFMHVYICLYTNIFKHVSMYIYIFLPKEHLEMVGRTSGIVV